MWRERSKVLTELELFAKMYTPLIMLMLANPLDLIEMDMTTTPKSMWFISEPVIERGRVSVVQDRELKYELIKFCLEHPERIWKGELSEDNEIAGHD